MIKIYVMKTIIESQELGLAMFFGLVKFSPRERYHQAAIMVTIDEVLIFDDTKIDLIDEGGKTKYHQARFKMHLTNIAFVTDEKLVGRRKLKGWHRIVLSSKNGREIIVIFSPRKQNKNRKRFLKQFRDFKIEVAKGKADISI